MIRKALLIASLLGLSGCTATQQPSRMLTLTATPILSTQPTVVDRSLRFSSQDLRSAQYIALINNDTGANTPLPLSQNLRTLLSNSLKAQWQSQGYQFNDHSVTKVNLDILNAVVVVQESAIKHKLAGNMQWEIVVTTPKGKLIKRYTASSESDGALKASDANIEAVLNRLIHRLLSDVESDAELNAYLQGKQQ